MSLQAFATLGRRMSDPSSRREGTAARTPTQSEASHLPDLPVDLHRHVIAVEENERQVKIYVNEREKMSGPFLSWQRSVEHAGFVCEVEPVTVARLQQLRLLRPNQTRDEDGGKDMLQRASRLFVLAGAAEVSDVTVVQGEHDTRVIVRLDDGLWVAEGATGEYSMFADDGTRFARAIYNGLATNKKAEDATYDPRAFQYAQIPGDALPGAGLQNVRILRGPSDPIDAGGGFLAARLQPRPGATRSLSRKAAISELRLRRMPLPQGDFAINGLLPEQIDKLKVLVGKPHGMIIHTGPTGSGKTTTMFKAMEYIARTYPNRRQITIENPIEYSANWATQLLAGTLSFAALLAKTLRMDPDVLMLSEMRDAEEAWAALQAALTGHLVFTTTHVKDPYRVFQRLEDMDPVRLSRRTICDHEQIVGVVGQSLLPLLCPHCRQRLSDVSDDVVPSHVIKALRTWADLDQVHVEGAGCDHCDGTGHMGRQALAQILVTDEEFMTDIRNLSVAEAKRRHRSRPDTEPSLTAQAVALVLAGKVSPLDAQVKVELLPCDGEVLPPLPGVAAS
ncbi:GspE/PulE family protein [Burkholderia gladioli]|uniref:GspE/PulE family protein n=1 Tax=Burkholderia gladioli TaxID=28095 RepID=UPI001641AC80|nr:ATPase, T2SS/T4P/T4SS family [Burkholderia gladioli]